MGTLIKLSIKIRVMKKSITCKGLELKTFNSDIIDSYVPKSGDVGVFEVIEIGKHNSIQGINGNNCYLFEGDRFCAAFGNRYATEQFEGYVPNSPTLELDILGKGGVVGVMSSMHMKFDKVGTTKVRLVSYATDKDGRVLNTIYNNKFKVGFKNFPKPNSNIILSLGCSMDSGKTTTAAYLARSLKLSGKTVAFIKLTGTYYTKDAHFVRDCGADISIDFGLAGYPSTYMLDTPEILDLFAFLLEKVKVKQPDYIIVEIADGLFQRETEALLQSDRFKHFIDHTIFSGVDSLSAINGYNILSELDLRPFALTGLFTASPLLYNEVRQRVRIPVLDLEGLINQAPTLLNPIRFAKSA